MERWTTALRLVRDRIGARPRTAAAFATGAVVALASLGLWSCQSTGPKPREPVSTARPAEPDVRVRIRNNVDKVRLEGPQELAIEQGGKLHIFPTPVVAEGSPTGILLTDRWGKKTELTTSAPIEVRPANEGSAAATKLRIDGKPYAGRMTIIPEPAPESAAASATTGAVVLASMQPQSSPTPPSQRLDVIETVPLETYLAGVLPAELPAGGPKAFHPGAFPVQAICARTYALHQRERSRTAGRVYDLEAGESDQAYLGAPDIAVCINAAKETRGIVLTWGGDLLRAYYSSTCGGRSASAADVWPTGPGYEYNTAGPLQGKEREHACEQSPLFRWSVPRPLDELSTRIREWGKANGHSCRHMWTLASLKVDRTNETGRPTRYIITDTQKKEIPINAEHLRVACNYQGGGTGPAAALPKITRETRVPSGDMEITIAGKVATIKGRGFGHGVGMCQYCIDGMAKQGLTWKEMIPRFYPGVKVERAY
jgi:stage II sporulation protein D